jgi:hypothetical protein
VVGTHFYVASGGYVSKCTPQHDVFTVLGIRDERRVRGHEKIIDGPQTVFFAEPRAPRLAAGEGGADMIAEPTVRLDP